MALITLGKEGALLVTEKEVKHIRPMEVEKPQSFVGNGTAATVGFMVGYIKGLPHEKSADLAMAMAAEKIQQRSPYAHIVAPEKALKRAFSDPSCVMWRTLSEVIFPRKQAIVSEGFFESI